MSGNEASAPNDCVSQLVDCLRRLKHFEEQQSAEVAVSQRRASELGSRLHALLEQKISGEPAHVDRPSFDTSDRSVDQMLSSQLQREMLLLEAFSCLRRLYVNPNHQVKAERVFDLLREFHRTDTPGPSTEDLEILRFEPPVIDEQATPEAARQAQMERMRNFIDYMRKSMDGHRQQFDTLMRRKDSCLAQALEVAMSMEPA